MTTPVRALRALAKVLGVARQWRAFDGTRRTVPDDTLLALVRLLGAEVDDVADAPAALAAHEAAVAATVVEPVVVQWGTKRAAFDVRAAGAGDAPVHVVVETDTGEEHAWSVPVDAAAGRVTLPVALPVGVHRLHVEVGAARGSATVLAAPAKLPPGPRAWGLFAPLYALHDDRARTGDYTTFDDFSRFAGSHGARLLGTLPLLATFLGAGLEPTDPSPYSPVSRRYWNEVYLDLARVPDLEPGTTFTDPSPGPLVDLPALARAKRPLLEQAAARLATTPARRDAYEQWVAAHPGVLDYARFRTRVERGVETTAAAGPVPYHAYVQWLVATQLTELARNLDQRDQELYLDLPIGAHPGGYDVAAEDGLFARGAAVGAPPDRFFTEGQNWGFPPVTPMASRATGHRYLRESVASHLQYARRLRVDHCIGFHRLWWVPPGATAKEGAYVAYPAEEQYAALMVAAARAGGRIVGENLGTVPPATNRMLRRRGLLGMYVLPFEMDEEHWRPRRPPDANELACLGTHDTATFATWWRELPDPARAALVAGLAGRGVAPGQDDPERVLRALLADLGTTDAEVVLASLEDLWLEVEAQNVPGTSIEHPNFRRRSVESLTEIASSSTVAATLDALDRARRTGTKWSPARRSLRGRERSDP